ncbi:MAG: succinylglutamate desuccinylase/aspartoacylase family protein [Woeseiaceae bacterium]
MAPENRARPAIVVQVFQMRCPRKISLISMCAALLFMPVTAAAQENVAGEEWTDMKLLGRSISPGNKRRFSFIPDNSFETSYLNMPVFVTRGNASGPTLCVTAGVHGDELNGIEVARRVFARTDPMTMRGTLIALPAINAAGVRSGNRNMSDRRDLNRAFPGRAGGSVAALIAYEVFTDVLRHCGAVVDLHTASNNRANLPQVRADISDPEIRELAIHFGLGIVVAGAGPDGSLRREVAKSGIPAIIYEAGEPHRFQAEEIDRGVEGVENVMAFFDMIDREDREIPGARVYERSRWVRAPRGFGGFFFPIASLGDVVAKGEILGKIVDPFTDESLDLSSPIDGEIIGMSVSQPVLSGYALFHVAWHDED